MNRESIDIAKGIGIILMVVAHAGCPDVMSRFISLFHMPLFFAVSGYCFKEKYLSENKEFVWHRVKGLYLPFVKWSLLFLVFHNVFFYLHLYDDTYGFRGEGSQLYTAGDFLRHVVMIVTRMGGNEQLLGGFWFLRELLFASCLSLFALKYLKSPWKCLALFCVLTIICNVFPQIRVPYFGVTRRTMLASFFFVAGYTAKNVHLEFRRYVSAVAFVILALTAACGFSLGMNLEGVKEVLPYMVLALLGIYATFYVSEVIHKRGWGGVLTVCRKEHHSRTYLALYILQTRFLVGNMDRKSTNSATGLLPRYPEIPGLKSVL